MTTAPIYTASDIAKRIKRPKEPLGAAVARFKNWAKSGLIKQVGARNPGTGRKKRYAESALAKAFLLQVLTDALGAPAARVDDLADYIIEHARDGEDDKLFVLGKKINSGRYYFSFLPPSELLPYMADPEVPIHVVIKMDDLWSMLGIET